MDLNETLYVTTRDQWRSWLEKNYNTKKEIWLIYYKKHTGQPRIPYDDAVEEAICFGWIDSTVQRLDDERYAQKYTPRNANSIWSQLNIKRARKMIELGRMTKAGLDLFKEVGKKKNPKARIVEKNYAVPADLKMALTRNKKALGFFESLAPSYKKMYVFWIEDAKKLETRKRRIKRVVQWAAQNKKPGMM